MFKRKLKEIVSLLWSGESSKTTGCAECANNNVPGPVQRASTSSSLVKLPHYFVIE